MKRLAIVNVGAHSGHRPLRSALLPDGSFELVPIPDEWLCEKSLCYSALPLYTDLELDAIIPEGKIDEAMHFDPEFETYTYGDSPRGGRASRLKEIEEGDVILFYANLTDWDDGWVRGNHGFYFVGYLVVEEVFGDIEERPTRGILGKISQNAHVIRGECDEEYYNGFWVWKGGRASRRLESAVPFDRRFIERHEILDVKGRALDWRKSPTEMSVIASYFRAVRVLQDKTAISVWRTLRG
jgi:hypothetical protein